MKKITLLTLFFVFATSLSAITLEKIEKINQIVNNSIIYNTDYRNYKKVDYWAKPKESALKKSGDCEDFAILKYAILLRHGVKKEDMTFIYTFYKSVPHIILRVNFEGKFYYLDNIFKNIKYKNYNIYYDFMAYNKKSSLKEKLLAALS